MTSTSPARAALILCALFACAALTATAQSPRAEYRAFWVDTFNTALNNHSDVLAVVNNVKAAKANAIFAQVRRRGDSWYLNSLEPRGDRTPIQPGFDPLQDLINEAHANGIEVHAFVIMSAIWGRAPNLFPPENPNHAFNLHGGFNAATNRIEPGPNNWLTRTLIPDGTAGITYQGHRFVSDFWIDFGHPDAAAYTANVVKHLVANYDIDGLHLDRIRYPEIGIAGQTPSTGTSVGYNPTSIARFQRRFGQPGGSPSPAPNNAQWTQWRRDQVSNVVRRVYLESIAVKPNLKISAALIAFGGGPTSEALWNSAEAYWRVYQDWRAWTEEGIIDIAIPMVYKAEHTTSIATQFNQWNEWTKNHQYARGAMMGLGGLNNAIEGSLRQTRRALTPSSTGKLDLGVIYFSMATSNVAVTANPFAIPVGNTPVRPFAEFASGLTTGGSVNGTRRYEPANLTPIFSEAATIPALPWKNPATVNVGHVKGFALREDDTPLDTATVTIENLDTQATRTTSTDGNGFFGAVDLKPGSYRARVVLGTDVLYACFGVTPGSVATSDARADTEAPVTTATLSPSGPDGTNGWYRSDVTVNLSTSDDCSGVTRTEYSTDEGATWQPYAGRFVISKEGTTSIQYRSADQAGNSETIKTISILLDKTVPTLNASATTGGNAYSSGVWTNQDVRVSFTCSDDGSGVESVSDAQTVGTEGAGQSVEGRCTDRAGNTAVSSFKGINIDKTAPVINATRTPEANANGWNNTDVTASYTASDALSGLAAGSPASGTFVFSTEGANQSHTFTVFDQAGNHAGAEINAVNIDKTPPTVNIIANPSIIWPANGRMIDVEIRGSGTDAISGLAGVSYVVTDEYGAPLAIPPRALSGTSASWAEALSVEARRAGEDRDGRVYRIVATITDLAGHTASASTEIVVPHDRRLK